MTAAAPLFSILTPVYDPPIDALVEMVESVLAQTYAGWELVLVDDCSPDPRVREVLRDYARRDDRIRLIERETNGHIVVASNDALSAARGEFVALLDHDDKLVPFALERNAQVISKYDDVDYIYSDEDKIDASGRHYDHFAKPDWSPERFRSHMYTCHLSVIRSESITAVGGFREGFEGSQDHDLVLRVSEVARRVEHIPEVLYHWRVVPGSTSGDAAAKPYAHVAGRQAVQEHLDRVGIRGKVRDGVSSGLYRVERELPAERRVSVIVATGGAHAFVWGQERCLVVEAVRSVLAHTDHPNLEVVIVHDRVTPEQVLDDLRELANDRLVLVRFDEPFNYSRKINLGVLAASGHHVVLLDENTEIRSARWIEELVAPLEDDGVGVTGAKLFFGNTRLEHVGLAFAGGECLYPYRNAPGHAFGEFGEAVVTREVSGVSTTCLAVSRETFLEVGGLCERLSVDYAVDFNHKVGRAGYRRLFVPFCELFHFALPGRSRTERRPWAEQKLVRRRWGRPARDAYTPVGVDALAGSTAARTATPIESQP